MLEQADLTIHSGWHLGLIGDNGSGKSSLFKVFTQSLQIDSGELFIPKDWRIAHMQQEVSDLNRPLIDYVIDGHHEYRHIESNIEQANASGDHDQHSHWLSRFDDIHGYQIPSEAAKLLNGLGFDQSTHNKKMSEFSGGWQVRANLARALIRPSDLLLLDEPTNHLDLDAILWLEQWLTQYPGTLILISHDREFLDATIAHTVHINRRKLDYYKGNYSQFEKQKAEQFALQQASYDKQQAEIAHIENFIRRFKAKATKAKQAQSRVKALERMELIAPAHIKSPFTFTIPIPEKTPSPSIKIEEADLGYADKPILNHCQLRLHGDERIGLIGPNGAGKSTLIKSIVGKISPLSGEVWRHEHCKIGYFDQNQLEQLDLTASPLLQLQRIDPKATEQALRNFLGGFNFKGDKALEPITHFSGGEKCRLVLAMIVWQKPNLLVLDEPTNHLDLEMREALCLALQDYVGALVLVSHDRHLIRMTTDQLYLVADGSLSSYEGDLDDYAIWLKQFRANQNGKNEANTGDDSDSNNSNLTTADKKEQRKQAAEIRKQLNPLKNALKKTENKIEKLEEKKVEIENALADSSVYDHANKEKLLSLLSEQTQIIKDLEECEEEWMTLTEEYETLENQLSN